MNFFAGINENPFTFVCTSQFHASACDLFPQGEDAKGISLPSSKETSCNEEFCCETNRMLAFTSVGHKNLLYLNNQQSYLFVK